MPKKIVGGSDDDFVIPQYKVKRQEFKVPKYNINKEEQKGALSVAATFMKGAEQTKKFSDRLKGNDYNDKQYTARIRKELKRSSAKRKKMEHDGDTFVME